MSVSTQFSQKESMIFEKSQYIYDFYDEKDFQLL